MRRQNLRPPSLTIESFRAFGEQASRDIEAADFERYLQDVSFFAQRTPAWDWSEPFLVMHSLLAHLSILTLPSRARPVTGTLRCRTTDGCDQAAPLAAACCLSDRFRNRYKLVGPMPSTWAADAGQVPALNSKSGNPARRLAPEVKQVEICMQGRFADFSRDTLPLLAYSNSPGACRWHL